MAKLADVASEVRIGLKLLAGSAIVIAGLFMFLKGGQIFKQILLPSPPAPAEEKFGALPRIEFPAQSPSSFEYKVNTLTGRLPVFEVCTSYKQELYCKMKVYKTMVKPPTLTALQTVRNNVRSQDFINGETKLSEANYQWSNSSGDVLLYNIFTDNFRVTSNYLAQPATPISGDISRKDIAFDRTKSFLEAIGQDISDIDKNKTQISFLRLSNLDLIPSESLNNAQFMRLDLYQKDLDDKYSVHYPYSDRSTMHFMYKIENSLPKIAEAVFYHYTPDLNQSSSYPIKTAEMALEDLKSGRAFILSTSTSRSIDITDVSLGYYAGEKEQEYLQPVIVFKGKDFLAYVPAVKDTSIKN